ncbi:MAG TPA: HU family DNA-binding protein [Planctomycetota bacterium]|nr:HU family DNA-binding protein [Planctomycetota bacterium]
MQRKELAEAIAQRLKITDLLAKQIVKEVFIAIIDTVIKEGRLEMRNFGVFSIKERKPRKARNPKTGAEVLLPARKVLVFKPGCNVKKKLARG